MALFEMHIQVEMRNYYSHDLLRVSSLTRPAMSLFSVSVTEGRGWAAEELEIKWRHTQKEEIKQPPNKACGRILIKPRIRIETNKSIHNSPYESNSSTYSLQTPQLGESKLVASGCSFVIKAGLIYWHLENSGEVAKTFNSLADSLGWRYYLW